MIDVSDAAVDAAVPPGVTHIGFVATNSAGDFLLTEPEGHAYGVKATFAKVKRLPGESPSRALARCLETKVGKSPEGVYPVEAVWVTPNSTSFYFAGMLWCERGLPSDVIPGLAWHSPDEARRVLESSANVTSRRRDLGLLAAAGSMCLYPCRRVLLMVRELHRMGFQQLRAPAYMDPARGWRCPVVPATWTFTEHGGMCPDPAPWPAAAPGGGKPAPRYSSPEGQRPFGWPDAAFAPPRDLARRFVREYPEIAAAGWGPDRRYAAWFEEALQITAPNGLYSAYEEPPGPSELLFAPLTRDRRPLREPSDCLEALLAKAERVPLPPPGLVPKSEWLFFSGHFPPPG